MCCCHFKAVKGRFWGESVLALSSSDALKWGLCEDCKRITRYSSLYAILRLATFAQPARRDKQRAPVVRVYSIDCASVLFIVFLLYMWCYFVCLAVIVYTPVRGQRVGGGLRAAQIIFHSLIVAMLSFLVTRFAESVLRTVRLKNSSVILYVTRSLTCFTFLLGFYC